MQSTSRYIYKHIQELALQRGKMAFISGPRQVGKTTLTQFYRSDYRQFIYKNWDETQVKKNWTKDPALLLSEFDFTKFKEEKLLVLDEIHKSRGWKSKLKGLYDVNKDLFQFIVTGSAKLNVYKKGSDSLMGRYLHFRLHPFSVREIHELVPVSPQEINEKLFVVKPKELPIDMKKVHQLYEYSGFPEPFFQQNKKIHVLWKRGRQEKILKEDILDLSRIQEISKIEILCSLLPEKIGSPLSVQSLREDISASHDSVTRWLSYLRELYYYFELSPYSKSISRSLKKDHKIYFFDWTTCETEGAKFENFVASHLLKACHFWEDTGEGEFGLQYLRDKDKNEVDFLVIKNKKPWFSIECKLKDTTLDLSFRKFQKQLNCPHIQVIFSNNTFQKVDSKTWIMGVDMFLGNLI